MVEPCSVVKLCNGLMNMLLFAVIGGSGSLTTKCKLASLAKLSLVWQFAGSLAAWMQLDWSLAALGLNECFQLPPTAMTVLNVAGLYH